MRTWVKILAIIAGLVISTGFCVGTMFCAAWFLAHLLGAGHSLSIVDLVTAPLIVLGLAVITYSWIKCTALITRVPRKSVK
jgi:hypothetical protein